MSDQTSYLCRACSSSDVSLILDMGMLPIAGEFPTEAGGGELEPLQLDLCETCGVLQVRDPLPVEKLFGPKYSYASSTIQDLNQHFDLYADLLSRELLPVYSRLLEIGCNDGIFLLPLRQRGFDVLGVEASANVAEIARQRGLGVIDGIFESKLAQEIVKEYGNFDVITCSNVFAHNPNVRDFLEGINILLTPAGEFWIEVHSASMLVENLQWDFFYHEHAFYWSLHSLVSCLEQFGFGLVAYAMIPMHGGSLRARFKRQYQSIAIHEEELTIDDWKRFSQSAQRSREIIHDVISALPIQASYGASGRAVTLIYWTRIADYLEYIVDASPLRFDHYLSGTSIPIISERQFFRSPPPDWCFVTAYPYYASIRQKIDAMFHNHNIRYILPLPTISIV